MKRDERSNERVRRAQDAYDQAQQAAGRLAMQAQQAAAGKEHARWEQNLQRLSAATEAALARLDAQGFPGVQMVHISVNEKRDWLGRVERVAVEEPGWQVHHADRQDHPPLHSDAWGAYASIVHREDIYLLADGTFFRHFFIDDTQYGRSGRDRVSLEGIASLDQQDVDGVITGLDTLGHPKPPVRSVRPQ